MQIYKITNNDNLIIAFTDKEIAEKVFQIRKRKEGEILKLWHGNKIIKTD